MSTSELTNEEMAGSLTGFDEIAITKHMGIDVYMDARTKPVVILRSLVFVDQRRRGLDDAAAKNAAQSMTLKDCQAYFAVPPAEVDDDDPDTDAGKGSSEPETTLTT